MIKISASTFYKTRICVDTACRRHRLSSFLILLILVFNSHACGKKGPLYLEERPLPVRITDFTVQQRQNEIILSWSFPNLLSDNSTPMVIEQLQALEVWHTQKDLKTGPFEKFAKRYEKYSTKEIPKAISGRRTLRLPFSYDDLDRKTHSFALSYRYDGHDSDQSLPVSQGTFLPARAISDLTLKQEGKHLQLKWSRPLLDSKNHALTDLIGYRVYGQEKKDGRWQEEKPLTKTPITAEYYEHAIEGADGEYRFRLTALSSETVENDFSNMVAITLTDTLAPQAPSNLVCLAYEDHMIITWGGSNDQDLDHYRIFRKESHGEPFQVLIENVTATFYRDYTVKRGKQYIYLVTAVDKKGNESQESNISEGKLE